MSTPDADLLMALGQLTRARLADAARDVGLPVQQVQALCRLRSGPRSMTALAGDLGVSRASVTELVDRLQQRGLAERTGSPADRRVLAVGLTAGGADVADEAHRQVGAALAPDLSRLGRVDRAELRRLLAALVAG